MPIDDGHSCLTSRLLGRMSSSHYCTLCLLILSSNRTMCEARTCSCRLNGSSTQRCTNLDVHESVSAFEDIKLRLVQVAGTQKARSQSSRGIAKLFPSLGFGYLVFTYKYKPRPTQHKAQYHFSGSWSHSFVKRSCQTIIAQLQALGKDWAS